MKKVIILLILAIIGLLAATAVAAGESDAEDGVFIHVSHGPDDPQRFLMALNMANIMAGDHDVLVYFDVDAIDAILKDSAEITFEPFPSSKKALASLVEKGVTLMACPGCLEAAGKTKEDLADGLVVADKKTFFSFTKGRILSLDY